MGRLLHGNDAYVPSDFRGRFGNTTVQLQVGTAKPEIYYVGDVRDNFMQATKEKVIPNLENTTLDWNDKDVKVTKANPDLGYFNIRNLETGEIELGAKLSYRVQRQFKQGSCFERLRVDNLPERMTSLIRQSFLFHEAFLGNHVSIEQAAEMLRMTGTNLVALSRNFALYAADAMIYYRGLRIAVVTATGVKRIATPLDEEINEILQQDNVRF